MQRKENTSEQLKCVSVHGVGTWRCPFTARLPGRDMKDQQSKVWSLPVFTGHPGQAAPEPSSLTSTVFSTGLLPQLGEDVCHSMEGHQMTGSEVHVCIVQMKHKHAHHVLVHIIRIVECDPEVFA